jgi:hypothetical protein
VTQEQFWARVDVRSADECWPWTSAKNTHGYGFVRTERKTASRKAYELAHCVDLPGSVVVRHSCDNPICCNPLHLLSGSHADNSRDKVRRGRARRGDRHPFAKLSDEIVRISRKAHAEGETVQNLASAYGVAHEVMRRAIRGMTWGHVA